MRRPLVLAALSTALAPAAAVAQAGWETEFDSEAVIVLAPGFDDEGETVPTPQDVLFELSARWSAERVLDNGVEIGARATFRVQRDHVARPGFAGTPFPAPAVQPVARGAFSGLAAGPEAAETGSRAGVESAFVYARGGYGEVSLGRDTGVAARFHEGEVGVFSHARIADPWLDPSAIALTRTRNDLTGRAAKLSYTTPRLIGLRAGLSFAPEVADGGLDRSVDLTTPGVTTPELENAVEAGLNFSRRLRASGVRVRAGLGYSRADIANPAAAPAFGDKVEAWSAGTEISAGDVRLGLAWLGSDEGVSGADYEAWTLSAATELGAWTVSAGVSGAGADLAGADGRGYSLGARRALNEVISVAIGYQAFEADPAGTTLAALPQSGVERDGIVIEITLRP